MATWVLIFTLMLLFTCLLAYSLTDSINAPGENRLVYFSIAYAACLFHCTVAGLCTCI